QRQDLTREHLGHAQWAGNPRAAPDPWLRVHRVGIVNTGGDAGVVEMLGESVASVAAHDVEMIDVPAPRRLMWQDERQIGKCRVVVLGDGAAPLHSLRQMSEF